jgi:hypothetical protein
MNPTAGEELVQRPPHVAYGQEAAPVSDRRTGSIPVVGMKTQRKTPHFGKLNAPPCNLDSESSQILP